VAEQHPDGGDPVTPADFLAGCPRSGIEADRLLDDPVTALEQPCRNLRLDIEPIRCESEPARDGRAHDLVAGLHVGDGRPIQDVGQGREHAVGRERQQRSVRARAEKAGSIHDIGLAAEQRFHEPAQLRGIQLEVGILNCHDAAAGMLEPEPDRVPFSAIPVGVDDPQPGSTLQRREHFTRAVAGAVVDDDDLAFGREVDREEPIDYRADGRAFIEDGNDDRDERSNGNGLGRQNGSSGNPGILRSPQAGTSVNLVRYSSPPASGSVKICPRWSSGRLDRFFVSQTSRNPPIGGIPECCPPVGEPAAIELRPDFRGQLHEFPQSLHGEPALLLKCLELQLALPENFHDFVVLN
jgi:hypothetical protein